MKILLLSPYHSGSHQAWAEGLHQYSQHELLLLTLPGRFWQWRMRGGAATLSRQFMASQFEPDLILADDMLDLTTFLALTREKSAGIPVALYMHENQLTYPLPSNGRTGPMRRQRGERDYHFVFINYASMLAADAIFFNSQFHMDSFLEALPKYLKRYPDHRELESIETIKAKASNLALGINLQRFDQFKSMDRSTTPPLILWNQRWEFDKNPKLFFDTLYALKESGRPFRLAICGENFQQNPTLFNEAKERLAAEIIHFGYAEDAHYAKILWEADITISTADHEFFGISILEAIYCHTFPLLPNRLSYPELIPNQFHARCLYSEMHPLLDQLNWTLENIGEARSIAIKLSTAASKFDWQVIAPRYDRILASLIHQ